MTSRRQDGADAYSGLTESEPRFKSRYPRGRRATCERSSWRLLQTKENSKLRLRSMGTESLSHLPRRTHLNQSSVLVSMGICRSSCANTSSLEYYDAWGHQPIRRPYRPSGGLRPKDDTKLWMCERGCCSIRWKLDYAEFQNYFKYVEVSPYVVMQDKTQQCDCVMCRGMADASPPQRRWKDPFALQKDSNSPTDGSLTDDEPERPESP